MAGVSSKPAVLSVPQGVTVPAGASAVKFDLQTYPVATEIQAVVTASAGGIPVLTVSVSPKTVTLAAGRSR